MSTEKGNQSSGSFGSVPVLEIFAVCGLWEGIYFGRLKEKGKEKEAGKLLTEQGSSWQPRNRRK